MSSNKSLTKDVKKEDIKAELRKRIAKYNMKEMDAFDDGYSTGYEMAMRKIRDALGG